MQQAIRYHHHPENAGQPYYSLVGIVHISDVLAMLGGSGTGIDNLAYRIAQGVQLEFDLDRKIIEKIVFEIDMEYLTVMDRFNNIFGEKNE